MLQDPDRVVQSGSGSEPHFARFILVDQTDANLYTVYLVHFES